MKPESLDQPKGIAMGINLFPGMRPDILEVAAQHHHALVLFGNALGGIAGDLIPTIKKIISNGTPIFVLTNNASAGHGVVRIVDQPQVNAIAVGVTYLEKANITHQQEVFAAIETAVAEGLRGPNLALHIQNQFKYADGEKPVTDMGTDEGLARFHARVDREMGL